MKVGHGGNLRDLLSLDDGNQSFCAHDLQTFGLFRKVAYFTIFCADSGHSFHNYFHRHQE